MFKPFHLFNLKILENIYNNTFFIFSHKYISFFIPQVKQYFNCILFLYYYVWFLAIYIISFANNYVINSKNHL